MIKAEPIFERMGHNCRGTGATSWLEIWDGIWYLVRRSENGPDPMFEAKFCPWCGGQLEAPDAS